MEAMNVVLLLLFPLFFTITIQSSPKPSLSLPRFVNSLRQNSSNETIDVPAPEYFEVTLPLPTDDATPACSVNVLSDSFGNTSATTGINVCYTPPNATCEWSHAVLHYQAEYKGDQYESIAGVWMDGVELLRTSTAQPTEDGVLWNVRKDVTRYSSIFTRENLTLSVKLENLGNGEFTGVYQVNVSLLFYSDKAVRFPVSVVSGESEAQPLNRKLISDKTRENKDKLELDRVLKSLYPYEKSADLIVPISGALDEGHWFRIHDESDVRTTNVQIPPTTYKAVLELYVSFHGGDEFWYLNPPDSYIQANHLPTGRTHGAYREVLVTIDGKLVGTVIPFPVIFAKGINPLFWEPVVSIGAFDLPSYDIDLTPFLGLLSDNKIHSIGLQVANGISYWLVDANLHLWLDDSNVQAIVKYEDPTMDIENEFEFEGLEGKFETEVERKTKATSWVQSSSGLQKTKVTQEIIFKNKLKIKDGGTTKQLEQKIKTTTKIKMTNGMGESIGKIQMEKIYPVMITIQSQPLADKNATLMTTSVVQRRSESFSNKRSSISRELKHKQNCTGSMLVNGNSVNGNSVIGGSVENHQSYEFTNEAGCYSRKVDVVDGVVIADETMLVCVD
ncbi:peptide-N4-(N-acetyl-beta-glucosaminyl)asparagine amidase A-like [Cynara cardunculus var. scolymus]|uniref:Peptide-N4-(N-acetyl-beta-glucosaminyl)asparagine amidase A n=1 Tax=Cynara cardunculus var. scolymus TaxID=59895 RepID=A0A103Y987_CYNCS|nr:peptide-N4-(N-acetyl-beta-glucosaminyl)asparagine amidase A-like [Cynara cardunculus var. scolymus]KVI04838.1 Peptide-N4-(N-acetyl-beta-glucosaminyl)asparagine amidase A [Cynara cardunculus var. scolymus]